MPPTTRPSPGRPVRSPNLRGSVERHPDRSEVERASGAGGLEAQAPGPFGLEVLVGGVLLAQSISKADHVPVLLLAPSPTIHRWNVHWH